MPPSPTDGTQRAPRACAAHQCITSARFFLFVSLCALECALPGQPRCVPRRVLHSQTHQKIAGCEERSRWKARRDGRGRRPPERARCLAASRRAACSPGRGATVTKRAPPSASAQCPNPLKKSTHAISRAAPLAGAHVRAATQRRTRPGGPGESRRKAEQQQRRKAEMLDTGARAFVGSLAAYLAAVPHRSHRGSAAQRTRRASRRLMPCVYAVLCAGQWACARGSDGSSPVDQSSTDTPDILHVLEAVCRSGNQVRVQTTTARSTPVRDTARTGHIERYRSLLSRPARGRVAASWTR